MISTNTYIKETIPYFYIIQHKTSKKMYAGSRWAVKCHPNEFMQSNGYTTSSKLINSIINQEGLESFDILRIDTNLDGLSAYDYETKFLQCNDCSKSSYWFNQHNNTIPPQYGTIEFYDFMLLKHGNKNYNNRDKYEITCLEKYDHISTNQVLEIKEKQKNTKLERYGNENYNNPNLAKQTKHKIYGDENYNNRDKYEITCLEKYGYISANQVHEIKEKSLNTKLEKNGGKYFSEDSLISMENTLMLKYNVKHNSQIQVTCPWCDKTGGLCGMKSEHFDKCKLNPNHISTIYVCPHCNLEGSNKGNMFNNHFDKCKLNLKYVPTIYTCPWCDITSYNKGALNRWHFDNCKLKVFEN